MVENPIYLVITIASIVVAIIFYIKGVRKKMPIIARFREKVLGIGVNAPPELKLFFGEVQVSDVYRTTFLVLNRGKVAIRKSDIVGNIRIIFNDSEILRQPIIHDVSNESIGFRVAKVYEGNQHQIDLTFDYLNENDGAIFEVLHTNDNGININARLIDVNKIIEIKYPKPLRRWRIKYYFVSFVLFCGFIIWGINDMITKGPEITTITTNGDKAFNYGPFVIAIGIAWLLTFIPDLRDFYSYFRLPKWSRRWLTR